MPELNDISPAPWKVEVEPLPHGKRSVRIISNTGGVIALCKTARGKKDGNANLMASAPELFEALDEAYAELLADSTRDGPRCLLLTTIEAALAKAKGVDR